MLRLIVEGVSLETLLKALFSSRSDVFNNAAIFATLKGFEILRSMSMTACSTRQFPHEDR